MAQPPAYYTEEQAQNLVNQAVQEALAAHQANVSESAQGSVSAEQVQALIAAAVAEQAEAHNKAMQQLAASMRGAVQTFVPEHSGGPGTEIAETWSQYEQEQARKAA